MCRCSVDPFILTNMRLIPQHGASATDSAVHWIMVLSVFGCATSESAVVNEHPEYKWLLFLVGVVSVMMFKIQHRDSCIGP